VTYDTTNSPTQRGDYADWTIANPFAQTLLNTASQLATNLTEKVNNMQSEPVKPPQRRGHRTGESYDTGVEGENANRYNAIKQEILDGLINPSINQLRKKRYCSQHVAKNYLEHMVTEGILTKNPDNGHYSLT